MSSDSITNRTRVFEIAENDWREKTGNVTFFVEISAFNQNYSVYSGQTHSTRSKDWRWRLSESRFNLTILHESEYESVSEASRIICFNGQIRTLTRKENCKTTLSKNITIDHLGQITIVLGNYFSIPDNFKKAFNEGENELKSIFQISLAPNKFHNLTFRCEAVSHTSS